MLWTTDNLVMLGGMCLQTPVDEMTDVDDTLLYDNMDWFMDTKELSYSGSLHWDGETPQYCIK